LPCTFFLTSQLACMLASQTVVHPSFNLYNFFSLITSWEHCRATFQVAGKSTCLYFESWWYPRQNCPNQSTQVGPTFHVARPGWMSRWRIKGIFPRASSRNNSSS
jgi:hypothetical protein